MGHISALLDVVFAQKTGIPLSTLLKRPSLIERDFLKRSVISTRTNGEFREVQINHEMLLWPVTMDVAPLLRIVAEQSPSHPHRYDWGNTPIAKGDVVLDIGACEGSFSVYAASKGARVVCVEPSITMLPLIERLFELRSLPKPILVNKLVGRSCGVSYFCDDQGNIAASTITSSATPGSHPVEVTTFDALVTSLGLDRVDFIKCDAEGADVDIIKSAEGTLRRFHPRIAVTTYHADDHYSLLSDYLASLDYKIRGKGYIYIHGKYRPVMLHAS